MSPQEQCTGLSEAVPSEIESNLAAFPCPRANEGRAAAEGVPFSNTPPLTSKSGFTGGEDWFEWCLYVDWVKVWEKLQPNFKEQKR